MPVNEDDLRLLYGSGAVISRKEPYILVHLDNPDVHRIEQRTREFNPDTFFACGCAICDISKQAGVVVFDDAETED